MGLRSLTACTPDVLALGRARLDVVLLHRFERHVCCVLAEGFVAGGHEADKVCRL